ncbi:MAG: hypothetical protein IPK50_05825 [Fibrobacterota bacterium]|nr:hypothetical protein [Fibrobacterota bacterium]QQS06414.1 MAG: hypothetical protein IPK50_05825 [Fibrobacterota bacterium]
MLNLPIRLPLHRKSLHTLLLFLAAFTLSTPLVSCGDGPKAKGKTFGHVNKKEAISLGVIASETNLDSAVKKYLGKEFTFKDLWPSGTDPVNHDYSSRNKCGFVFDSPDGKVILTAWINTPLYNRFHSGVTDRRLPSSEADYAKVFEVDVDLCSDSQSSACYEQSMKLAGLRKDMPESKQICNISPENVYLTGRIAGIRKLTQETGTSWRIQIIPSGFSN